MREIATANELERELRRLLQYSQGPRPSRSRIASELQTLQSRIAGSKSYWDYLKDADRDFLTDVGKEITSAQKSCTAKVHEGISVVMLTLGGEDSSDMSIDGYATVIQLGDHEVKFILDLDTVRRGKIEEEKVYKIGVLTADLAAKIVLQHLRFAA